MLGVIICPHCTLVQGADLTMARITCPRCGGKIDVRRAKVYFTTDSPKELAEGVRQVGARMVYDIEAPQAPRPAAPEVRMGIPADEQSMRALAVDLDAEGGFSKDDVKKQLRTENDTKVEKLLSRMLRAGIIYELSPGRYRPA